MARSQTLAFKRESKRYFDAHREASDVRVFPVALQDGDFTNVLDVGCGNGALLQAWAEKYEVTEAMGVEPSSETIHALRNKWSKHPKLDFTRAFAHSLPFDTDHYDLVTCWSALSWVGRNEFLQSVGELVRVCGSYLVIMDFFPLVDYRVPYAHQPDTFTYKVDFESLVVSSGIMEVVEKQIWWIPPGKNSAEFLTDADLTPFLQNRLNYHARKMVVFKKNYELLPLHIEGDFADST